jgi:hypothetical protein
MVTTRDVLDEFGRWLAEQPETPAKQWVRENPPTLRDAARAVVIHRIVRIAVELAA